MTDQTPESNPSEPRPQETASPWRTPKAGQRAQPAAKTSPAQAPDQRSEAPTSADFSAAHLAALDAVMDRKRLRRKLFWWRLAALAPVVLVILGVIVALQAPAGPHIARFTVEGVIADDVRRDKLLAEIEADDDVKALILRIDSPGGTTVGGEALYQSIRKIGEKKPVVAVMGEVAASAGYIAAVAADHVVARGNSITASIGVIFQSPNFAGVLDRVGVEVLEVKSGPRKAQPSPFQPIDPNALELERALIDDSFQWFLGLVRERRSLSDADLAAVGDGRILTGRMALEAKLVDAIGGEREARQWLKEFRDISSDLKIKDREIPEEDSPLAGLVAGMLRGVGWDLTAPSPWTGPHLVSKAR